MKLIGLMHVRDEQWILALSLPAALQFVDEVVILDHASTDDTPRIIRCQGEAHSGRVHPIAWEGTFYNETAVRQRLLDVGRERSGTHFFMLDADEILTANLIEPMRTHIASMQPGEAMELPWLAMWGSLDAYRDDQSVWSNNTKLFAFADTPGVAYRPLADGYDIHLQTPRNLVKPYARPIADQHDGGVMHLQFANRRRLLAKHAWYKMVELVRFPGRQTISEVDEKYNQALNEDGLRTTNVNPAWWEPYAKNRAHVSLDDEPWHEREVLRLWNEHGPQAFEGLELWGLPQRLEAAHRAPAASNA